MFDTSLAAEAAFYEAFGSGDVEAMMRVWAAGADIVCIHPSGPRLEGAAAIRASWQHILAEHMVRSFDLRGRLVSGTGDLRVHLLEECISVPGTRFVAPPVLATNIYRRLGDGWYMVLHHASVAPQAIPSGRDGPRREAPGGPLH
ncbi:MAG: nuclear transport factor 2 family protein [Gammaproteobacteria bacterium]